MMEMQPVTSSMIDAVGYDPDTLVLQVAFKGGRTYRYAGVPASEFEQLINADSVGRHFIDNIKNVFRLA